LGSLTDQQLDELERRFHEGQPEPLPADDERAQLHRTHLARRLLRRRGYGVPPVERRARRLFGTPALAVLAALAAVSFAGALPSLRYWLSSAPPIDLGRAPRGYQLDGVPDGAFVKLEGIASPKRGSYSRFLREHEVFALVGSRILVDRAQPPDESLKGYGFRYSGDGRLARASTDHRWDAVRAAFADAGELPRDGELFVIEDGSSPRRGLRVPLEGGAWLLLFAVCAAVIGRRALHKFR
jgi:hypothetical protein